jgi:hypothetical protein
VSVLVLAPVLLGLAGCDSGTGAADDYPPPGAAPPPAAPPAPPAPPVPSIDVPPPSPGRPMTVGEKQYRGLCQAGTVRIGCELYSDSALRLQGIDPTST